MYIYTYINHIITTTFPYWPKFLHIHYVHPCLLNRHLKCRFTTVLNCTSLTALRQLPVVRFAITISSNKSKLSMESK